MQTDHIKKVTYAFSWESSFANKYINELVSVFNETYLMS